MADKEEKIEVEGSVVESFRSGQHRVVLDNGHETLGYTSGRMRRYRIRINPGDRVKIQLSPYDLSAVASSTASRSSAAQTERRQAGGRWPSRVSCRLTGLN